MLAYKLNNTWVTWRKRTRVNGIWPPTNAETALSDQELADHGLFRVTREAVPEGKMATAWALIDVAGLPVERPTLVDIPPPPTANELAAQELDRPGTRALIICLARRFAVAPAVLRAELIEDAKTAASR